MKITLENSAAPADARKWELFVDGTRLVLRVVSDAHTYSETLVIERQGARIVGTWKDAFSGPDFAAARVPEFDAKIQETLGKVK